MSITKQQLLDFNGGALPPLAGGALKSSFRAQLRVKRSPGGGFEVIGNEYWDGYTGGQHKQAEVKYTPYDRIQRVYTGVKTTDNITCEAAYDQAVHGGLIGGPGNTNDLRGLEAEVAVFDLVPGAVEKWAANRQPYKGLVLDVVPPEGDSNDASTISKIQIVVSVGTPG